MSMTEDDRRAIDDLFDRLAQAEAEGPPREAEAEQVIARHISQRPSTPYYMAQVILVQEHALRQAQERIAELERESRSGEAYGGFLGGLFGSPRPAGSRGGSVPPVGARAAAAPSPLQRAAPGSFLGGAMPVALGVAGGVMLGSFLAGMTADPAAAEGAPVDEGAVDDMEGGDFDDGGGDFDLGGDMF